MRLLRFQSRWVVIFVCFLLIGSMIAAGVLFQRLHAGRRSVQSAHLSLGAQHFWKLPDGRIQISSENPEGGELLATLTGLLFVRDFTDPIFDFPIGRRWEVVAWAHLKPANEVFWIQRPSQRESHQIDPDFLKKNDLSASDSGISSVAQRDALRLAIESYDSARYDPEWRLPDEIASGNSYRATTYYPRELLRIAALIAIPIYGLLAVLALVWLVRVGWRRACRAQEGRCLKCGYDLAGIHSDRCPECGTETGHLASA